MDYDFLKKLPLVVYESAIKIKDNQVEVLSVNLLDNVFIETLTGYTKNDFSKSDFWFSKIHKDDKPVIFQKLLDLQTNTSTSCTYRFLTANGNYLYLKNTVYIIEKTNDTYKNIGFVEDVADIINFQLQLQEQLELFELLSDESPVGVYMLNKNSYVYANKKTLEILGYTFEEIKNINPVDLFYEESDKIKIKEILQKRFSGEKFSTNYSEIKMLKKDKSIIYTNLFANTVKYKDQYVAFGVVVDVTDQKLIEKLYFALKEINKLITTANNEEELLKSICKILVEKLDFDLSSIGYIDSQKNFLIKYVSAQNNDILNDFKSLEISADLNVLSGTGSVGRTINTGSIIIVPNVNADKSMQFWRDYFTKHNIFSACAVPIFCNGKIKYVLLLHSKIANQFMEKYLDILEEIKSDMSFALQKIKDEQYKAILDKSIWSSSEWVLISSADGTIEYANQAVSDISGYQVQELIGKKPSIFKSGYHSREFYKQLWSKLLNGEDYRGTFINKKKSGELFYIDLLIIPFLVDGKPYKFVSLARDKTREVRHLQAIENLSNVYATLYQINQLLVHETSEDKIFDKIVQILIKYAKFKIVYTLMTNKYDDLYIGLSSVASSKYNQFLDFATKQVDILKKSDKNNINLFNYPFFKTIKNKRIYVINDISKKELEPFNQESDKFGIHSCCSIPIIKNGIAIGTIICLSDKVNLFDKSIYDLLKEIVWDINYTLDNLENRRWRDIVMLAIDKNDSLVGIMDSDFNLVYINEAVERLTRFSKNELLGKHHSIFSSKMHPKEFSKNFYETLKSGRVFSDIITYKTKESNFFSALTNIIPFVEEGTIKYYVSVGNDISKDKALYEKVNYLTNFDIVTNLPKRQAFIDHIERFIRQAVIEKRIGAIAVINPINFGSINKAYDYDFGNELLKAIAYRLGKIVRQIDIVAKIESDKFTILLKDLLSEEDGLVLMVNIIKVLSETYNIGYNVVKLSFNAGISLYPKDSEDPKALLEKAEIAVSDAKEKGESAIGFYKKEFEDIAKKKLSLRYDITKALTNREFLIYYQPYFSIKDKKIIGAEALLRWKKDNKIILPGNFIPFLEETGIILYVEYWLKNEVVQYISLQKNKIPISINISPISFKQRRFIEETMSVINFYSIDPSLITIEMLERTFIEDLPYYKVLLNALKEHKIKLSLDDFGTGYSSLSYVSELHFDNIKIDISFVQKMLFDLKAKSIVKTIINLAQELGMKTIAEGVETNEQLDMLEEFGCDAAQGYLLSKPIPKEEFDHLIGG